MENPINNFLVKELSKIFGIEVKEAIWYSQENKLEIKFKEKNGKRIWR